MNNIITAIEIGSSCVKLVVGYKFEKEVIVQFASTSPLNSHAVIDGKINDEDEVSKAAKELLLNAQNTLKCDIKEVVLVLPAIGLEVFGNIRMTPVLSTNNKISDTDIRNVVAIIYKDKYPTSNEVIDVLPIVYILDNGSEYSNPPIGEESSMLNLKANVHTIPQEIVESYKRVIEKTGVKVKTLVSAPYAVGQLLSPYKEIPDEYFLVNIGDKYTTVTMISNGEPFKSFNFFMGGDTITNAIQTRMGISNQTAEKLKKTYGLDECKYEFLPTIATSENTPNVKFSAKDLRLIILDELDHLSKDIIRALKTLSDDETFEHLPVVFVGGGSTLIGIKNYMKEKIDGREVIFPVIRSIGARNMTYVDTLGGIKVTSNIVVNNLVPEEKKPQVLTREAPKKIKYSETDDNL